MHRLHALPCCCPTTGLRSQALAVYESLSELAETVWNRYEIALIELLVPELDQHHASQPDLFDFDDPLPF